MSLPSPTQCDVCEQKNVPIPPFSGAKITVPPLKGFPFPECNPSFGQSTANTPFLICGPSQPIFPNTRPSRKLFASTGDSRATYSLRAFPTSRIFCTSQSGGSAIGAMLPLVHAPARVYRRRRDDIASE